jgi:zinc D-Ala-D-Ala carboxypeptidase
MAEYLMANVEALAINGVIWRWKHIDARKEWACKGTGRIMVVTETLDRLELLRSKLGRPIVISSGYRAPEYNAKVSPQTGRTGPHTTGRAADILVNGGRERFELVQAALAVGFTGIGVAKGFVHVDDVPVEWKQIPRPAIWTY